MFSSSTEFFLLPFFFINVGWWDRSFIDSRVPQIRLSHSINLIRDGLLRKLGYLFHARTNLCSPMPINTALARACAYICRYMQAYGAENTECTYTVVSLCSDSSFRYQSSYEPAAS